jgi:TolB-like protein/class 3 adenylate cyclase
MPLAREQRKLAAIVAADVVGYSRLMGRDESGTLARLRKNRSEHLDPVLRKYGGRLVKLTGDGALVEFASAVDALSAAIEFQQAMAEANRDQPADTALVFRMGLHLGDLIVDGDDLYGDGVNIAARLEAEAPAGGIVISRTVHEAVTGRLKATFDDLGILALKNIERPIPAFSVKWEPSDWQIPVTPEVTVATTAAPQAPLPLPDKPSIAVLPFQNMSGDPEQEYFVDGLVEDIITALSRFKSLFVIARNSSFAYKGKSPDLRQVGRDLGVRYVLEGSVRKASGRLRITAQLIDATSGAHAWADRFEGALKDVFELQDDVTEKVVAAIAPRVEQAEIERRKHKPTDRLDAYDCYLRAMMYFHQWTSESVSEALRLFYMAIELDPEFASAHGLAAWCYVRRRLSGWMKDPLQEMPELERLARRAGELANDDPMALYSAGWALVQTSGYAEVGAAMIDRALTINPNMPAAWLVGGWTKMYFGEADKAITYFRRAIRLNPLDPLIARMQTGIASAQFLAGHYKDAALSAQSALRQHPIDQPLLRVAAASHALAGQTTDAQHTIARVRVLDPQLRLSKAAELAPCRRPEDVSKYVDGLRKAGLPE